MCEYELLESVLIKKRDKTIWIIFLFNMPLVFVLSLIIFNTSVLESITYSALVFLFAWSVVSISSRRDIKKCRRIKILVDDDKIVHQFGKQEKSLLWQNINKVKVSENKTGNPVRIKLCGVNKKSIDIYGFSEIMNILTLIKEKISDKTFVQTKRILLNSENPFVLAMVTIAYWPFLCVVFYILFLVGKYLHQYFQQLFDKIIYL